ncbi:MAG TPA: sigma-54 dependent transcriptional regulator [Gemmatimonadales bacterium]|nr:sigma-54 dependent transcriptional regulator [Gemmatimonadales bacterium]
MSAHILVVDDEESIRAVLRQILRYEGYEVSSASSGGEALLMHRDQMFDLVILDVKMQGIDGLDTLAQLRQEVPSARVIMISGHATIGNAVQAVKEGAFDFLEKPLDADRLLVTVARALEHRRLVGENARLRAGLATATDEEFIMVGESPELAEIRALVARIAPTDARVLITGENGSGKELVARAIHAASSRRGRAFVEVNCAAIPRELVESELFGHVKGAFTGAVSAQDGKFDAADGGTLFLDEIGDLALEAQAKILRALQEGVITRVGAARSVKVDVRVVAATNRDLSSDIAAGRFREDLYYRLAVLPIDVPPLRKRPVDIPDLVAHFVRVLGSGPGMTPKPFSAGAIAALQARRWFGNVRELRNAVERLLILSTGPEVTLADVERALPRELGRNVDLIGLAETAPEGSYQAFLEEAERAFLEVRLSEHDWNVSETARALDIPRSTLHTKLERLGIERRP